MTTIVTRLLRDKRTRLAVLFWVSLLIITAFGYWLSPYASGDIDMAHRWLKPFSRKGDHFHLLGTDKMGRDIFTSLCTGTWHTVWIAGMGTLIATFIGLTLGGIAGFDSIHKRRFSLGAIFLGGLLGFLFGFIGYQVPRYVLSWRFIIGLSVLLAIVGAIIGLQVGLYAGRNWSWRRISWSMDTQVMRLIEVLDSLPGLILLIILSSIGGASVWKLIWIFGLLGWTSIARFTRGELMKYEDADFVTSGRLLGFSWHHILWKYALPIAVGPALLAAVLGFGRMIIAEAGLSFLGIGVPQRITTWGSLLAQAQDNLGAWQVVLFPSILIFLSVYSLHTIVRAVR